MFQSNSIFLNDKNEIKLPNSSLLFTHKSIVKRKFPGPAGILPETNINNINRVDNNNDDDDNGMICTQTSFNLFQDSAWLIMLNDFKENNELLERFNIKWICTKAVQKRLNNQKAPFLAAIIKNVEYFDNKIPYASITLKDCSGEIEGTINCSLYEKFIDNLTIGSVIILKNFSVLTTNSTIIRHYLTITDNNLTMIYSKNIQNDKINHILIQNYDYSNIIKENDYFNSSFHIDSKNNLKKKLINDQKIESSINNKNNNYESVAPIKKKFKYDNTKKQEPVTVTCSQLSVKTEQKYSQIWQNALEDIDVNSLFEDF